MSMYQNFFGLQEQPFSIAPDPHYLYLSERHQEALAHLTQGLQGSGGFILLTGEVGTGKTTVSRALLEQLPESTRTAFILNPMLNEDELLATLCDEFGIRYQKRQASRKTLTDKLSQFLLKAHQQGEQCVVLIDEAQHLKPQVLEQLRLLTNLETHQSKLLRVILIGQPELQDLLRRRELRQLAQRITARYHILPLTAADSERYIAYRLQTAGATRALFTQASCRAAHKATDGIPRLLNLVCDRALLAAYTDSADQVQPKHVATAVSELDGGQRTKQTRTSGNGLLVSGIFLIISVLLLTAAWVAIGPPQPAASNTGAPTKAAQLPPVARLAQLWELPQPPTDQPFCQWVERYELACLQTPLSMTQMRSINYPALLMSNSGQALLLKGTEPLDTQYWNGELLVLYQQPFLGRQQAEDQQQWLKQQLMRHLPSDTQGLSSEQQLLQLQRQVGLPVSGRLDAPTLAWLSARYYDSGPRLAGEKG